MQTGSINAMTEESSEPLSQQYLTFIMNGEEYGVDILCVQEIRGWEPVTPLPNAPSHIKGVINLRGTIVPIVDLRQCFGLSAITYSAITVVIVLKVSHEEGCRIMGVVVDAVSDVYTLSKKEMKAPPNLGSTIETEFIEGFVSVGQKMIVLLDIDKLLIVDEMSELAGMNDLAIEKYNYDKDKNLL
ncbi:chemotaxis protein CheW [Marinagarivorans algicola]|uniref:chemotaxis protein CheW n=1 Tax=Marinagarivorans algicola TaxID=1513270 RepID=UPI0006B9DC60|nr:chemotaxis protein CheW [Marinagarivorans algicola]